MCLTEITPDDLLDVYSQGCFPMADSANDLNFSICAPEHRSLLPIETLHVPKSLRKRVLKQEFDIRINTAFSQVIDGCAEVSQSRNDTWINPSIKNLFNELHDMGHAHSVEAWKDDALVGGLYGLQLGSAFCGESMFSRATDASKVALVHLCARLSFTGFTLLDSQLKNPHLEQFGQMIVPQERYMHLLEEARRKSASFTQTGGLDEMTLVRKYLHAQP